MRFRFLSPLVLFVALSCDSATSPEAPFVPEQAKLDRATVLRVDMTASTVSSDAPAPKPGVAYSLVGRDVIEAVITNVSRTSYNKRKDIVRFDLAIVNRIPGIELRPPTLAPPAPTGSASVFVFPYHVKITSGKGDVNESDDWNGDPFSFFNDLWCRNGRTSDCFPWEAYPAPLSPGATSPTRRVGFVVEKSVKSFDVYLLTAADLAEVQTGTLEVSVTSPTLGALPAVKVVANGSSFAVTDANGVATFGGTATGAKVVTLAELPAGCVAPDPASASVTAGSTAQLALSVTCVVPTGTAAGTVFARDVGALANLQMRLEPGGYAATTDSEGRYAFSDLRPGVYALTMTNAPPSCHAQNAAAVTVSAASGATLNLMLDCPAPLIAVAATADVALNSTARLDAESSSSPAGAPLTFTWTQTAGSTPHEERTGAIMTWATGERPGLYSWRLDVSDGLRTVSRTIERFVMKTPGKAVFVSVLGNDNLAGTRAHPLRSLQLAVTRAAESGADVYMTAGSFPLASTLVLPQLVSVYGRMNPETWVHESPALDDASDAKRTVIEGPTRTMESAVDGVSGITLAYLTIRGAHDTPGAGSAIGVSLINSTDVTLRDNEISAGNGIGVGASSIAVFARSSNILVLRNHLKAGNGTRGSDNESGAAGRNGNAAFDWHGASPLVAGWTAGGDGGFGQSCAFLSPPAQPGKPGDAPGGPRGENGANGQNGIDGGLGAFVSPLSYSVEGFIPWKQASGTDGARGGSGGGGGGGAKETTLCVGGGDGEDGGGGGSGGEGGKGATSGGGGGASIALYVSGGQVAVESNTLQSGNGGDGGDALHLGGIGGVGGLGRLRSAGGGDGGNGGAGGRGGPGHPGAGGDVVGIVNLQGGMSTQQNNTFIPGTSGRSGLSWNGSRPAGGAVLTVR